MNDKINFYLTNVQRSLDNLEKYKVGEFAKELLDTYDRGGTIFIFGNGGSGATASHFCGDLLKGVSYGLEKRFKAICLNDNYPALLAIANDLSYEDIFIEQLKNFLHPNDLVIGISGSGNSKNIIKAISYAKSKGTSTFGLCGFNGGKLKQIADNCIHVNINDMEVCEDIHMFIIHCTKRVLMEKLKDKYQHISINTADSELCCKYCKDNNLTAFLDIGETPLANSNLTNIQLANKTEKKYPLKIYYCEKCGLCQVGVNIPPEEIFSDYIFFSSTSDWAKKYSKELAEKISNKFHLNKRSFVIEVASNDGCYLKAFKELGNIILGIEPAKNIARVANENGVDTYNDFLTESTSKKIKQEYGEADIVLAMNVFPHVPDPHDFVKGLRNLIKKNGVIIIHSHYLVDLLKNMSFDTFYHEHYTYISTRPVQYIFNLYGMEIFDIDLVDIYCGSAIYYIGNIGEHHITNNVKKQIDIELNLGLDRKETFIEFGKKAELVKKKLIKLLSNIKSAGKTIAGYGAAAKGNTLLNYCGINSTVIDFIADKSEYKQGLYTPGSHIPIVHPSKIIEKMPDYLLILAWNFGTEIIKQQSEYYKKGGKFIIPLSEPGIVCIDEKMEEREIIPGLIIKGVVKYG